MIDGVPLLAFEDAAVRRAGGIAVDRGGAIYTADLAAGRIQVYFPDGERLRAFQAAPQNEFAGPFVLSIDPEGTIYVPDPAHAQIQLFSARGHLQSVWKLASDESARQPYPVAVVATDDGFVYVGDGRTGRVAKLNTAGERVAVWGDAKDASPLVGLAVWRNRAVILRRATPQLEVWTTEGVRLLVSDVPELGSDSAAVSLAAAPSGEIVVLDAGKPRVMRLRLRLEMEKEISRVKEEGTAARSE
jgi:DNA-binding beta-propeller fold protein YncE